MELVTATLAMLAALAQEPPPAEPSLAEYILKGTDAIARQMKFTPEQLQAYRESYNAYLEQKIRENKVLERCNAEDSKKLSKFCKKMREKFTKSMREQARIEAQRRKQFIDDCKKEGGEATVGADFWDCKVPEKAKAHDGPAGETKRVPAEAQPGYAEGGKTIPLEKSQEDPSGTTEVK
jgi:hypothetical protein